MNHFELYIFDLDGTLVNSLEDLTDAVNMVLDKLGLPHHSQTKTASYLGKGARWLLTSAIQDANGDPDILLPIARQYFLDIYKKNITEKSYYYDGVIESLEQLSQQDIALAICTNKPIDLAEKMLEKLGHRELFKLMLGGDSLATKKPDPAPLQYIMDKLSISPKKTLMIGDSSYDINAGKAAHCKTCAVTYGYHSTDILLSLNPDFVLDHFQEIHTKIK